MAGTLYTAEVAHDGGVANVGVVVNHDGTETATVRFGSSYTLRLDEANLDDLINVLETPRPSWPAVEPTCSLIAILCSSGTF